MSAQVRPSAVPQRCEGGVGGVGEAVAVAEVVQPALALDPVAEAAEPADAVASPGRRQRAASARRRARASAKAGSSRSRTWNRSAAEHVGGRGSGRAGGGASASSSAPDSSEMHDRVERRDAARCPSGVRLVDLDRDLEVVGQADLARPAARRAPRISAASNSTIVKRLGGDGDRHAAASAGGGGAARPRRRRPRLLAGLAGDARRSRPSRRSSKPASSRKRRARRTGLSSSSPRKPPSEKSLSTTRWNSRARSWRRLVVRGEAAQPVRAHLHVGDLVGEHPVLAELEHRVAGDVAELAHRVEDVDGQALERPVHAGEAQHGVGVAGGLVEERRLGELADLGAHPVAELDGDLAVAGLVPALAGHVELELEGDLARCPRRCRCRPRSPSRCGRRPRGPGSRPRRCRASARGPRRGRRRGRA